MKIEKRPQTCDWTEPEPSIALSDGETWEDEQIDIALFSLQIKAIGLSWSNA